MGASPWDRRIAAAAIALGMALAWTGPSAAAVVVRADDYVLEADEVVDDDLVFIGDKAHIAGRVQGDLVAVGGEVRVEGTIDGDLLFAGKDLILKGRVGDDLRAAGYAARLTDGAVVGDDVSFAGFGLEALEGSRIGGDVLARGQQALLEGRVAGDLDAQLSSLALEGEIRGNADATALGGDAPPFLFLIDSDLDLRDLASGVSLSEDFRIRGDLRLKAPQEPELEDDQLGGQLHFEQEERRGRGERGGSVDWQAIPRRTLTIGLVATLLSWLGGEWLGRQERRVRREPLPSLAWGVAAALGVGMLAAGIGLAFGLVNAVAGAVTLGGLSPAILGVGLLLEGALLAPAGILAVYVAPAVVSLVIGRLVLERFQPDWIEPRWRLLATGALGYAVVVSLPWLGRAVGLAIVLVGLGAIALGTKRLLAGEEEPLEKAASE